MWKLRLRGFQVGVQLRSSYSADLLFSPLCLPDPGGPGPERGRLGTLSGRWELGRDPSTEGRPGCREHTQCCTLSRSDQRNGALETEQDSPGQGRGHGGCGRSRGSALPGELLHLCPVRWGAAESALTWHSDLNDIQVLWLNFDGSQPTQLPRGSCEGETRDPVRCGCEPGRAGQVIPEHSPVCDLLVVPGNVTSALVPGL